MSLAEEEKVINILIQKDNRMMMLAEIKAFFMLATWFSALSKILQAIVLSFFDGGDKGEFYKTLMIGRWAISCTLTWLSYAMLSGRIFWHLLLKGVTS
jgi:hypothetical protein